MSTREFDPSARGGLPTLPRRSFLQFGQTYIAEVHVRRGNVASWAEYFDTAVLNEAFTP